MARFNTQKKPTASKESGFLYGYHPVCMALNNKKRHIKKILLTKNTLEKLKSDKIPLPASINISVVERPEIDAITGKDAVHQGIIAYADPLPPYMIEDLINDTLNDKNTLIVLLDKITDPHNIGAILRSAAAFNAKAVILPESGAPEESATLAKSASGALELIPLIRVPNLARCMDLLKKQGFWCIGLDGYATNTIFETKLPQKCALVMGAEGEGLRRLTIDLCDSTLKLPINPQVESLNVSNACAITLYEWNRLYK